MERQWRRRERHWRLRSIQWRRRRRIHCNTAPPPSLGSAAAAEAWTAPPPPLDSEAAAAAGTVPHLRSFQRRLRRRGRHRRLRSVQRSGGDCRVQFRFHPQHSSCAQSERHLSCLKFQGSKAESANLPESIRFFSICESNRISILVQDI